MTSIHKSLVTAAVLSCLLACTHSRTAPPDSTTSDYHESTADSDVGTELSDTPVDCAPPSSLDPSDLETACRPSCSAIVGSLVDEDQNCVDLGRLDIIIGCVPLPGMSVTEPECRQGPDMSHVFTPETYVDMVPAEGWVVCSEEYKETISIECP